MKFLVRTLVAESLGKATINFGGKLSLGPPPGGMILAQPVRYMLMSIVSARAPTGFNIFCIESANIG
jgi:hypothetical protein